MKFSICIPNYNYERYLGRTIQSVLAQSHQDFEIAVSDNASTDRSVAIARSFGDERIQVRVNHCNVGFAGNLDRAGSLATGDRMIMLSSDDLVRPEALATYNAMYSFLAADADAAVVCSTVDVIDSDDNVTGQIGLDRRLWHLADRQPQLESIAGAAVYGVRGDELLRRCLLLMKNCFNFAATCYPRRLYQAVEGYGGNRLINPDKWFHWKLLGRTDMAYFIDRPLFAYRWHPSNQVAQQAASGALKYLIDQYAATVELDSELLSRLGLERADVERAFVKHDIAGHGLATLATVGRGKAKRIAHFGRAAYPRHVRGSARCWALRGLLALGPVGAAIARSAYRRVSAESGGPA